MAANGYYGQQSGDLRATVAISQHEASFGTTRMLNLPDGRMIHVTIPPGTRSGQEIRLEGQGQRITPTGPLGALILTVSIPPTENFGSQPYSPGGTDTPTEFIAPPPPPVQPFYPGVNQGGNYTNYPAQGQIPPYVNSQGTAQPISPPSYVPNAPFYGSQGQSSSAVPQKNRPSPRRPLLETILIAALALLIILGSVFYYATVYQPQQQHAQATATAVAQAKSTRTAGMAQATATGQSQFYATETANAIPLNDYKNITGKTPDLLNDPLTSPSTNNWDTNSFCSFKDGSYHASENQTGFFYDCAAKATNFTHFLFQTKMTFLKGIYGGIFFRSDPANSKYYLLRFDQETGGYDLYLYTDKQAKNAKNLMNSTASAFKTGLNQTNQIAILARGKTITLYVNGTYVDTVDDATFGSGEIGVFAEDNQESAEIAFSQAQVWNA